MLVSLLRKYLAPYKGQIALVVLLQFVQTLAMLYLPTLNADIIDQGVVRAIPTRSSSSAAACSL